MKATLRPIGDRQRTAGDDAPAGDWKPLTRGQKARLAMLAAKAYAHQRVCGMSVDEWRHEVAWQTCGRRISEAVQRDYSDLKAAFLDLAGEPEQAFRQHVRGVDHKRRVALYKLREACEERGLHESYPASICMTQFRCGLEDATAKQLWCLVFTVRNRRQKTDGHRPPLQK